MSIDGAALFALKKGILHAVEAELTMTEVGGEPGTPHRVCVVAGEEAVWDECECGQLTVHHRRMWPSERFPLPSDRDLKCGPAPWWAVEVVVTVVRCAPETGDESPPPCDEEELAALIADQDAAAMQRGVACTLGPAKVDYVITGHEARGPGGMCVGSQLVVIVKQPNCVDEC